MPQRYLNEGPLFLLFLFSLSFSFSSSFPSTIFFFSLRSFNLICFYLSYIFTTNDTMCHSTVFWYTCDHLIPTDTICPFKETLIDHTKTTTKTAYVEDACCLCKQPCSPTVESLRANLISVQKLTSVFQLESRDGHFPEEVTRFFATGEHLQWMQPGAGATPATPVSGPALTPSPTVVDASPSKSRRASAQVWSMIFPGRNNLTVIDQEVSICIEGPTITYGT